MDRGLIEEANFSAQSYSFWFEKILCGKTHVVTFDPEDTIDKQTAEMMKKNAWHMIITKSSST